MEKLDILILKAWKQTAMRFINIKYKNLNEDLSRDVLLNFIFDFNNNLIKLQKEVSIDYGYIRVEGIDIKFSKRHNRYVIQKYFCEDDGYTLEKIVVKDNGTEYKKRILFINEFKLGDKRKREKALRAYSLLALAFSCNNKIPLRFVIGLGTYSNGVNETVLYRRIGPLIIEYLLKKNSFEINIYRISNIYKCVLEEITNERMRSLKRKINKIKRLSLKL